MQGLSTFYQK